MVALLIMAFRAVREVWIEDSRETDQPDDTRPTGTDAPEKKPDIPAAG